MKPFPLTFALADQTTADCAPTDPPTADRASADRSRTNRVWPAGVRSLAVAALGALTFAACGGDEAHREPTVLQPVSVTVTPAWTASAARSFTARIEAAQTAHVATRMSGTVTHVAVDVGSTVRAGDLLARLDDADVRARISAAEAQHALAEQTQGRIARLAADGAASQQEFDVANAQLAAAQAGVTEARAQAAYVEVRAPFAGVVTARMVDAGALALPGQPIMSLQGEGALEAIADLPASEAGQVSPGQVVTLSRDGASIAATIRRVVPALDARSRRFRVEVALDEASPWPAGEVVTLNFAAAGTGSQWIPADAVVRRGQLAGVFTVENDSLRLRWMRLGRTVDDRVEVLAGPAGDLQVVRRPGAELRDGAPVSGVTVERVSLELTAPTERTSATMSTEPTERPESEEDR